MTSHSHAYSQVAGHKQSKRTGMDKHLTLLSHIDLRSIRLPPLTSTMVISLTVRSGAASAPSLLLVEQWGICCSASMSHS